MFLSPLFDGDSYAFVIIFFMGIALAIVCVLIPVVESLALYVLNWGKYIRCLETSYIMNGVSALGGYLAAKTGIFPVWIPQKDQLIPYLSFFLVFSILVEWCILNWIVSTNKRNNLKLSLIANLVSYFFQIPVWLKFFYP